MTETLYAQLGGEEAITAVVDGFYDRVLADDSLTQFFEDANMQALRSHQVQFFSSVTGGPVEYTGADMREAHAHLDITQEHFAAIATHLTDTLDALGVDDDHVDEVVGAVAGLEGDIVTA